MHKWVHAEFKESQAKGADLAGPSGLQMGSKAMAVHLGCILRVVVQVL